MALSIRRSRVVIVALALLAALLLSFANGVPAQAAPPPNSVTLPDGTVVPIPAGAKPDLIAFIKNGDKPVLIPSGKLTPSSTSYPTEIAPAVSIPSCLQPPANFDLSAATPAQLKAYGIGPQTPGEARAHWLAMHSGITYHACSYSPSNATSDSFAPASHQTGKEMNDQSASYNGLYSASLEYDNNIWTGKVADQNCGSLPGHTIDCNDGSHTYTETDSDYYVNCGSSGSMMTNGGSASEWMGLGGTGNEWELYQAGTTDAWLGGGGGNAHNLVYMFWEYVGPQGKVSEQLVDGIGGTPWPVGCGDHMYTKIYGGDCADIIDLNANFEYDNCFGPDAGIQSAEAILERNGDTYPNEDVGEPFGTSTTFYGVGITDKGSYIGMGTAQHDYENTKLLYQYVSTTGPIQNDPSDPPYDEYTVTVVAPCGGYYQCP